MLKLNDIAKQLVLEYGPKRACNLTALAVIDQAERSGKSVSNETALDILRLSTGAVYSIAPEEEDFFLDPNPWVRGWEACSVKGMPHREIEGIHSDLCYKSLNHCVYLDKLAWDTTVSQRDSIKDSAGNPEPGLNALCITDEHGRMIMYDRIVKGVNPWPVNIQPGAPGRFYSLNSLSWQSAKPLSYALRWEKGYSCTIQDFVQATEFCNGTTELTEALSKGMTCQDDTGRFNEAMEFKKLQETGQCNYIAWQDMSASGAWFIGALTGDPKLWRDLLSGDLYTEAGKSFGGLATAMSPKMFRQFMKALIMLTMYSITGYGFTRSLFNNHEDIYNFLWTYHELGDDNTTESGIKEMEKILGKSIQRLLWRYDGLRQFREWALKYGYKDKAPPKLIEWDCGGFTASHCGWGWEETISHKEAEEQGMVVITIDKPHPLSSKGCLAARTNIVAPTTYGPREVNLYGRNFGWGHGKRAFGPKLVHSLDAWALAEIGCAVLNDGGPFVGNHDAAGTDIPHRWMVNEVFQDVLPRIIQNIRGQFPTLPVLGDVDYKALRKIPVFR